jgi:hypothetical protein
MGLLLFFLLLVIMGLLCWLDIHLGEPHCVKCGAYNVPNMPCAACGCKTGLSRGYPHCQACGVRRKDWDDQETF